MTRVTRLLLGTLIAGALAAAVAFHPQPAGGAAKKPDFAGVYRLGNDTELTLAGHPHYPGLQYVGLLLTGAEQRIYPIKVSVDAVKGCHGVIYEGALAKQRAVELKLAGESLTFRYYDGPTLTLKRVAKPR